jgi:hypothetical protein
MSANDSFRELLLTVVGQAFSAAGYHLDEQPMKWAGGQFRFTTTLPDGQNAAIEFQHLAYSDTEWASGNPSRFNVTLRRSDGRKRDLSALVVTDFGVAILPSPSHWWTYRSITELGRALGEAGSLAVAYGMPWLSGELLPQDRSASSREDTPE